MSADELADTPTRNGLRPISSAPERDIDTRNCDPGENVLPSVSGTPSKVTINVRDRLPDSSPPAPVMPRTDIDAVQSKPDSPHETNGRVLAAVDPSSPDVISVSSSTSRSPEIEVAEIEDMNDEPGNTRWRSLGDGTQLQRILLQRFPYADPDRPVERTVEAIANAFEKDNFPAGDRPFHMLANWIEDYLAETESKSSWWWHMYADQQDFWDCLPRILSVITKHSENGRHGAALCRTLRLDEDVENRQDLEDFLVAFSALTARMVHIDEQTLDDMGPATSIMVDLVSEPYLQCLNYMCCQHASPFWSTLQHTYAFNHRAIITAIIVRYVSGPSSGFEEMMHMLKALLSRSPDVPSLLPKLWIPFQVAIRMMQHYNSLQEKDLRGARTLLEALHQLPSQAYELFRAIDGIYQRMITKQTPILTLQLNETLLGQLSNLLSAVAKADQRIMDLICENYPGISDELRTRFGSAPAELTWKFLVFRKCLVEGRMEIRVQGVEHMQKELVSIYDRFMNKDAGQSSNPVAQYVADLMLANRVVEYLVGVDSHPQLINRSGNIVGFLVITRRYRDAETDAIWRAVASSQDPRTADAILHMLHSFVGLSDYSSLLYLTTKLDELPLQAFDSSMISYARYLLQNLRGQWQKSRSEDKMDMPPYQMCIRLIQRSSADGALGYQKKGDLNQLAIVELQHLLQLGPSESDKETIFDECIADIRARNRSATGSYCAINALISQQHEEVIGFLARNYDLPNLAIEELSSMVESDCFRTSSNETIDEHFVPRLNLLEMVIRYVPDKIRSENGKRLWDSMLGKRSGQHCTMRDKAWLALVRVIQSCSTSNSFIDKCISTYLLDLDPTLFATKHALAFAEQVINYESRVAPSPQVNPTASVSPSGAALLWHMASTVPTGSIELLAIRKLVAFHLDSPSAKHSPRAALESVYVEVVQRCIVQLTSAATRLKACTDGTSSGEDEPMIIVISEHEFQAQKLSFSRSLLILKEFVDGTRSRPTYSPPRQAAAELPLCAEDLTGSPLRIRYQAFSGGNNTGIHSIEVGDLETFADLFQRLGKLTGFQKFTIIAGGQKLNLEQDAQKSLRDAQMDRKGLLIVKKARDDNIPPEVIPSSELMPLQGEIMKHFNKLHPLLDMEHELAKEVFDFLTTFPPHESISTLVCARKATVEEIFPKESPFKILYAVYALKSCLTRQLQNGSISHQFISQGTRLLAEVWTTFDIIGKPPQDDVDLMTAAGLVDCMLSFLREPTSPELAKEYVEDAPAFVDRLVSSLLAAQTFEHSTFAHSLLQNCFAVLLEASLHCRSVWQHFRTADYCSIVLQRLLLEDLRQDVRQGASDRLKGICSALPTLTTSTSTELLPIFWQSIQTMIPRTLQCVEVSQQFFDIALFIFHCLDHMHRDNLELQTYAQEWSQLLFAHEHTEVVGLDDVDWVAFGISSLLQSCIQLAKSFKKPMHIDRSMIERIFHHSLFPPVSSAPENQPIRPHLPIVYSPTRHNLYSIVLALSNDIAGYQKLLELVKDLLPEDYHYEANWNLERSKLARSNTGYAGMKNLSNTCYLNSLITQLFMNIGFRSFMLNASIADSEGTQRLLAETKGLFAHMQETFLKSVDPQGIADSIVTYDNSPIDVSIQMDVDEFYNLLFDRWESQILSDADKKRFRSFYGGQIVQQIKSKECPHISERLEPFSAIQCDIHGKRSLTESLDAYVGGEVMEGDNKYSCTSCASYVDAEKRACLKDIPDNLIFHLKRFDYDVMSGLRSKINERFEFPNELDMAPYHVDTLKDPAHPSTPDVFNLVGVLVHSGTAESGHYYSYIRERPANPSRGSCWVEYNDADLVRFDALNIEDQCFGGVIESPPYNVFSKQWNAYCLFYQREVAMEAEVQAYQPRSEKPVKIEIPGDLNNRIVINNELFARKYCLLDPTHASFAKTLVDQLWYLNNGLCSSGHKAESDVMMVALEHLNQVFSRVKDCVGFHEVLGSLRKIIGGCTVCCKFALDWIVAEEKNVKNLLLRCPSWKARREFANLIVDALQYLREHDHRAYGLDIDEDSTASGTIIPIGDTATIYRMIQCLKALQCHMPNNSRGWDDYYGVLVEIAKLGPSEAYLLLREGFLRICLELLMLDHIEAKEPLKRRNSYYGTYLRLMEKGRKYSLHKLIELLRILLGCVDLSAHSVILQDGDDRPTVGGRPILSAGEGELLHFGNEQQRPKILVFFDKILSLDQNRDAAKAIVRMLITIENDTSLLNLTRWTITHGMSVDPATLAAPYLNAALVFCEACPDLPSVKTVLKQVALEVETIGDHGGQEHLEFFLCARRLSNVHIQRGSPFFTRCVLSSVQYWAPSLLMYWEPRVRTGTIDLLRSLVFERDTHNMDNEQEAADIEKAGRDLCIACVKRVQSQYIEERKPVETKLVEHVDRVIRYCLEHYCEEEDYGTISLHARATLEQFYALATSDDDDGTSDNWNNEISDNPSDSESETLGPGKIE